MSDQALVWKFAFGMLVLAFCAVSYVTRKDAEPLRVLMPVPTQASTQAPTAPPPGAGEPLQALDPAPADAPEAQEEAGRIPVAAPQPVIVKKHHVARHAIRKVGHRRHRRMSPYVAGRQHYPFDPRERWLSPLG